MSEFGFVVKNDPAYKFGTHIGFLAGSLLFASVLFFILNFTKKLPESVRYYHVVIFILVAYLMGYAALKLRK